MAEKAKKAKLGLDEKEPLPFSSFDSVKAILDSSRKHFSTAAMSDAQWEELQQQKKAFDRKITKGGSKGKNGHGQKQVPHDSDNSDSDEHNVTGMRSKPKPVPSLSTSHQTSSYHSTPSNPTSYQSKADEDGDDDFFDLFDAETRDILKKVNDSNKKPEEKKTVTSIDLHLGPSCSNSSSKLNQKKTDTDVTSKKEFDDDLVFLSDDDDDLKITFDATPPADRRPTMVGFFVSILCNSYHSNEPQSIVIHLRKTIAEAKEYICKKCNLDVEPHCIQLWLESALLDDDKTVAESNITAACTVDLTVSSKSLQELYEEKSKSILRFKMQTGDRTGRANCFVYMRANDKMIVARDAYAKEMNVDPSSIQLKFDGDHLNLQSTPAECDLDGEECLDVNIKT